MSDINHPLLSVSLHHPPSAADAKSSSSTEDDQEEHIDERITQIQTQVESSVPPSASRPGRGSESPRESLPSHAHRDPEVCITQDQNHIEPSDLHPSSQPPWPLKPYWLEPIFSLGLKTSDITPEMDFALIERKLSKYRRSSHSALLKEQFYGYKYVRRAFF